MTAMETAGNRLHKLLQRLPGWSDMLPADAQVRILEEGIAAFYRQMIIGLEIDETLLDEIFDAAETWDLDTLSKAARELLAKMGLLCDAPAAFKQDHAADTLFESLIRQYPHLVAHVLGKLGPHTWLLYTRLHELEARSRTMGLVQIVETQKVIKGIHLRLLSCLSPDLSMLEVVPLIGDWFTNIDEEHRGYALRIVALCLDVWEDVPIFLRAPMPKQLVEASFFNEADRVAAFLLEVDTILVEP